MSIQPPFFSDDGKPRRPTFICRLTLRHVCKLSVFIMTSLAAWPVIAVDYYFSGSGNDESGNGTKVSPWRTINKFNSLDLNPGDNVFFRAGEIFFGSLALDQNDTGTNSIGELI